MGSHLMRWTEDEIERAAAMAGQGKAIAEIAASFGRSVRATQSAMYRRGVSSASAKRPWSRSDVMTLTRMHQHDGASQAAIAAALGRSRQAVKYKIWELRKAADRA